MKDRLILIVVIMSGSPLLSVSFTSHLPTNWYPHEKKALQSMLDSIVPYCTVKKSVARSVGIIVPHAGYAYSVDIAAAAYQTVNASSIKKIIILAPAHHQLLQGVALPFFNRYDTPLGSLKIDTVALKKLRKHMLFKVDKNVWSKEHSVEIQLPLIQKYIGNEPKITPLLVGTVSFADMQRIAQHIMSIIDDTTLIIVSSDFMHYGKHFNYTPFSYLSDPQKKIHEVDMMFINSLLVSDAKQIYELQEQTGATICGRLPLILFKMIEKQMSALLRGELLCYKTSYDVDHVDPAASVSYVAMHFNEYVSVQEQSEIIAFIRKVIADNCDDGVEEKKEKQIILDAKVLQEERGLFITLRNKKTKELRGCMGHIVSDKSLAQSISEVAKLAAFGDPRFIPVTCKELKDLYIEVSILSKPYSVASYKDIILGVHGMILQHKGKSALFLPKVAIEQSWNVEQTLQALAQKAGIASDAWKDPETTYQLFVSSDFSERY